MLLIKIEVDIILEILKGDLLVELGRNEEAIL